MMVVGAEQKFAGALIVPNMSNLTEWCQKNHVDNKGTTHQLLNDPRVIELYKKIVEEFNQNFNHVEQVKKFELLDSEWTIDGGELTPTLKLKRKVIMEKYRSAVERIYS
jgi:long-chain acyl-CoA synthetase